MSRKFVYHRGKEITRVLHCDPLDPDGEAVVETIQDLEPLIEENKRLRELNNGRGEHFALLGRVPVHVYERAVREGWAEDQAKWRAWLNDPDNRAFRVNEGHV